MAKWPVILPFAAAYHAFGAVPDDLHRLFTQTRQLQGEVNGCKLEITERPPLEHRAIHLGTVAGEA